MKGLLCSRRARVGAERFGNACITPPPPLLQRLAQRLDQGIPKCLKRKVLVITELLMNACIHPRCISNLGKVCFQTCGVLCGCI